MRSFTGWTAAITGASAGLGADFARQLAPECGTLILVARREDRLQALREELAQAHPQTKIEIHSADLQEEDSIEAFIAWIDQSGFTIDLLVNNAGFGDLGEFASSTWPRVGGMISVNIAALTHLTHSLLPGMVVRRRGAILNVASTAGFLPLPTFAVYGATKAYVCSFSEALRVELMGTGVTVTALCPGPVETEFGAVASRPGSSRQFAPPKSLSLDSPRVVREAIEGTRRGAARVIPGLLVRLAMLLIEIIPVPLLRFFLGRSRKIVSGREAGS